MGGNVAVTLREPDGTEHRMNRWTNTMSWFVNNMKFVNKEPDHIKAYLDRWNEMRTDWELNKGTGKFEFPMTDCYAPYPFLAPDGYGLVVLDMKENVILSCQGYCKFGAIYVATIALDIHPSTIHDPADLEDERESVIAKRFFDADRAVVQKFIKKPLQHGKLVDTDIGYDELLEIIKKHGKEFYGCQHVRLDLDPFVVREYDENTGWDAMRADIEKLGFVITPEEDKQWKEWIEERKRELSE